MVYIRLKTDPVSLIVVNQVQIAVVRCFSSSGPVTECRGLIGGRRAQGFAGN